MSKTSGHRFHVCLPERQWLALSHVALQTQLSVSEVIRSIVERSLSEEKLSEIYPTLSGSLRVN